MSVETLNVSGLPNPTFSIIIPTWNLEDWRVRNCLWSLRQQTEQNVEVIISDINSDAEHLESLRQLAEHFDATLYHTERGLWSIAVAYNIGLRRCRGKCAATIDADIIFEPRVIEDTIQMLRENPRQMVVRQPIFLAGGVDYSSLKFPSSYRELSFQPQLYKSPSLGSFVATTREWWHKIRGYDERFEVYGLEDWEMWRRGSRDRLRKVLIGCAHKLNYPKQPPREGCKLYHQEHAPFRMRNGTPLEVFDNHREINKSIYGGDLSITRNDESWGMM